MGIHINLRISDRVFIERREYTTTMSKTYVYIAEYIDGKKTIELNTKDIEKAYETMVRNFGNNGFLKLRYSYAKK